MALLRLVGLSVRSSVTSSSSLLKHARGNTSVYGTRKLAKASTILYNQEAQHSRTCCDAVRQALLQEDSGKLIASLLTYSEDLDSIRGIPENTFTEILALIQPQKVLTQSGGQYWYKQSSIALLKQSNITPLHRLAQNYLTRLLHVLTARKNSGHAFNVSDYCRILETTRWMGLKDVAQVFWKSMIADEVTPNLKCYNNYLGAIVSNLHLNFRTRHKRRLTAFHVQERSRQKPFASFAAYRLDEDGIKEDTMRVYREMVAKDIAPDEETFRLMILGVARGGDLASVKRILRQVWNVDIDAVIDGQGSKQLARDSPLFPSPFLLYSIAHAFGINNDIPTALRVVDHMSRAFDVPIFNHVWHELFNWTFVLSRPRTAKSGDKPHLPPNSVHKLWKVMVNEPYNMQPTLDMYDKLIKSFSTQQKTKHMWHYMQEARNMYTEKRDRDWQLTRQVKDRQPTAKQTHRVAASVLGQKRSRVWFKRWVRLLLASMHSWHRVDRDLFWSTIQIPRIIRSWRHYLPSKVWYDIPGGRVSMHIRTNQDKLNFQKQVKDAMERRAQGLAQIGYDLPKQWSEYKMTRRWERADSHAKAAAPAG